MKNSITFKGLKWRVQLQVFDFEENELEARKVGWKPKEIKPTTFAVAALPNEAKRSTAFYRGIQLYYGQSLVAALLHVRRYADLEPQLPKSWKKYRAAERK